jgi:predicted patatin/cPLA2 family phospholipase
VSDDSTWEVLLSRRDQGSAPGARTDSARIALVIEGGGNRAAYSAGMAIALEQEGLLPCFDDVYGTSGGALNGAWMLSGEGATKLPLWASPEYAEQRVVDARRLLRGGPVVDLHHLVHHVYVHVTPMDFRAVLRSAIRLHPIATDADTGEAVDLAHFIADELSLQTALRASACLPLLAGRPVRLGERRFVDGGVAEPVPVRTALAQGATHVLVLRTRREGQEVSRAPLAQRLPLGAWFLRHAPGARTSYMGRHLAHDRDEAFFSSRSEVSQVRPPSGSADVARLTRDLALVAGAIQDGSAALRAALAAAERGRQPV